MCDSKTFRSHTTNKEYKINISVGCDSSDVVYLMEYGVCDVQYVGSMCTPFRNRFNNYKGHSRKFYDGSSGIPQAEFISHVTGGAHEGYLKDVRVIIIDRLNGKGRQRESFWQYKLETFSPQGINIKQVEE